MIDLLVEIQNTGYRSELLNDPKLSKLFDKTKFKLVISHVILDAINNYGELTKEEILDANVKKNKRPSLQKNTIYCYCELRRHDIDCDILQKLIKYPSQPNEIIVIVNELSYYGDNYNIIDIPIYKDLKFENNNKEVGWYNKDNNILWISDIGHFPDRIIKNFGMILANIIEFNRSGSIAVLPNLAMGCDIEFELFDKSGIFVPANRYLKDMENRNHKLGYEVGLDGHPDTGEIRPAPANNPIKLSRNIKKTVRKLVHKISSQDPDMQIFCGGGLVEHLGGHIHFNIENFNVNDFHLKHILYDLVGVHIKRGMGKHNVRAKMDQYMSRDAGDAFRLAECHPGWEWRFPPSFILNEKVCKSILCTTWCVIKEYYGYGFSKTEYTQEEAIKALTSLHFYPHYKVWIDQFIDMFILHQTAMEGLDIKKEWNIKTNSCNIIITSDIPWINEYFNSAKISVSRTIRISVLVHKKTELILYTNNLLSEGICLDIQEFADNHLVPLRFEHQPSMTSDAILYIPWIAPPNLKLASSKLKIILKRIISEIDKSEVKKVQPAPANIDDIFIDPPRLRDEHEAPTLAGLGHAVARDEEDERL